MKEATGAPIVVGEMGGTLQGKDFAWQQAALDYYAKNKIGVFYFALNPESDDASTSAVRRKALSLCRFAWLLVTIRPHGAK